MRIIHRLIDAMHIGFTKKMSLVLCACLLIACEPAPEVATQEHKEADMRPAVEPVEGLQDGFYTDQEFDVGLDQQPTPDDSSESSQEAEQTQSDVVMGADFSGVDDITPTVEAHPEPFCLAPPQKINDRAEFDNTPACQRISDRLASVSFKGCSTANLYPTGCESVSGFPILLSEFAPIAGRQPRGKVLLLGGTHGDELTSVSVTFRWIQKLNQHHTGLFHWHVVPLMNPDGVLKREASRTNQNGVDLNRNMPSNDWTDNAIRYWQEKGGKDPRKYPGQIAASEPETQWLIDEINRFKPDAIIAVHAPYGVVDFDSLALRTAPRSLGKLHLNLLGTYPGSLGNYAGINRNIPVITLELPHSWEMPSELETTQIWEDIVSWLKKNVNNPENLAIAD